MWAVARRPRWVALLVLALVLAGTFAGLGKWQLQRSIENGKAGPATTETRRSLDAVASPQSAMPEDLAGQEVRVEGRFAAGDTVVLTGRSGGGRFQTVGNFVDAGSGASLPVVIGYADTRAAAVAGGNRAVTGETVTVEGRYYPSESPDQDDFTNGTHSAVAVASLVNTWNGFDGRIYGGYVVATAPTAAQAHLGTIADRAPTRDVQFDWLNLFYAVEWVVFAGFAVFLWYRFVRDAWEREQDETAESDPGSDGGGGGGGPGPDRGGDGGGGTGGSSRPIPAIVLTDRSEQSTQDTRPLAGAASGHR
ncbi:SURF1 family cytochrome oxidase biogenesis protein [Curtobacterium sp. RRHDQ10]|uniref:SURF1 family cytochrome oxidase biogenesis protein n=1 Tax=Curtobacterium phyllosphaerae TaxID=3413379 RepID=UPI003BEF9DD9